MIARLRAAAIDVHAIKGGGIYAGINLNNGDLKEDVWNSLESLHDLREVRLDGKNIGDEQLARVCHIKSIEVFALGAWTSVTESGLAAIPQLPNLRSVEFRSVRLPLTGTLTALANCTKLSSISFTAAAPGLSQEGMKALGKLVQIKELYIDAAWVPTCTAGDFAHLSELNNLRELALENMVLPYDDGLAHLKGLNLKKLKLTECYVPDSDYAKLKEALPAVAIERADSKDIAIEKWNTSLEKFKKEGLPKFFSKSNSPVTSLVIPNVASLPASAMESQEAAIAKLKAAGVKVGGTPSSGYYITIGGDFPVTEDTWKSLESLRNIKSFWISHKDIDLTALTRISKIESVESFEMWAYKGIMYGGKDIGDIAVLAQLPNLHSLRIIHAGIPADQGARLLAFKDHPKLTSLTLNTYVSDEGMKAAGELTQLKEFAMRGSLSSTGISYLANLPHLERLHLDAMFNPSWTAKDLKYLSGLKNLQDLTLKETVLTYDDGLEHLKGMNLKHLVLRKCIITDTDFRKLQTALPGTKIERIGFYDDEVKRWNDALAKKKLAKK